MFSLFSPKSELGVIFHIGSASVGVGLIEFIKGRPPHVIYTAREHLQYREDVAPEKILEDLMRALKRVNIVMPKDIAEHLDLPRFRGRKIARVSYVFSSPWVATQTKIVTIKDAEGFSLDKKQIEEIIRTQGGLFEKESLSAEASRLARDLSVIEKRLIQIKLNGHEVAEPYGKPAKQADISLFMSLIPKGVLDQVLEKSRTTFHPKNTTVSSFPLVSFSSLRDIFHTESDFIFLDVGGEVTDVSVIKGGLILQTLSFPLGRNFLIRKVSKACHISSNEALSLIKLCEAGHAEASVVQKIGPILKAASGEWIDALHKALGGLAGKASLPRNVFTVIASDVIQFFMKALRAEKAFTVTLIDYDKLKHGVSFGKNVEKDPSIALVAICSDRLHQPKTKI